MIAFFWVSRVGSPPTTGYMGRPLPLFGVLPRSAPPTFLSRWPRLGDRALAIAPLLDAEDGFAPDAPVAQRGGGFVQFAPAGLRPYLRGEFAGGYQGRQEG